MANVALLLMCVAVTRHVTAFIENPVGSTLFSYLGMNLKRMSWLTAGYGDRCAYVARNLKKEEGWKKGFKFLCTDPWILDAMRKCNCGNGWRHTPLMSEDSPGKFTGKRSEMKKSSSYPPALGSALLKAWQSWCCPPAPLRTVSRPAIRTNASQTPARSAKQTRGSKRNAEKDFFDDEPIAKGTANALKRVRATNDDFMQAEGTDSDFLE
jgi:hypothetical protein